MMRRTMLKRVKFNINCELDKLDDSQLSVEDKEAFRRMWPQFDTDGSGYIPVKEIQFFFRRMGYPVDELAKKRMLEGLPTQSLNFMQVVTVFGNYKNFACLSSRSENEYSGVMTSERLGRLRRGEGRVRFHNEGEHPGRAESGVLDDRGRCRGLAPQIPH